MKLQTRQRLMLMAQIVALIVYFVLILIGSQIHATCVFVLLVLLYGVQVISVTRKIKQLDLELIEKIAKIERDYLYRGMSISRTQSTDDELKCLRDDIKRHLANDKS